MSNHSTAPVGIGIIGCGNISPAYLRALPGFPGVQVRGVADLDDAASAARAAEFGVPQRSVEDLLADPRIELIVNLTTPKSHLGSALPPLPPASTCIRKSRSQQGSPTARG